MDRLYYETGLYVYTVILLACPILTCGKSAERLGNTAGSRRQLAVLRLLKAVDKWVLGVAEAPKFLES